MRIVLVRLAVTVVMVRLAQQLELGSHTAGLIRYHLFKSVKVKKVGKRIWINFFLWRKEKL